MRAKSISMAGDITFEQRTDLTVSMEEFDNIRFLENPDSVIHIKTSEEFKSLVTKLDGKSLQYNERNNVADEISLAIQTMLQGSSGDLKIGPQSSQGGVGPNYSNPSYLKGDSPNGFHTDIGRPTVIAWIPQADVVARPLSWINPRNSNPLPRPQYPPYDPDDEYCVIPDMEKGDMLLIRGDLIPHGPPIINGNDGKRKALSFQEVSGISNILS
jgi:hypothetical protein